MTQESHLPRDPVAELFSKRFTFSRQPEWNVPEHPVIFVQDTFRDERLQELKERLNGVKSKLNDLELGVWSTHTYHQSPSSEIIQRIRETFGAEFVTQAWTKFYECLATFPLVPVRGLTALNTVHLCEAPGAFVVALNHFLRTQTEIQEWLWCASTLNVYYEGNSFGTMIADDRFIHTTLENWEFGSDQTGDITCAENVEKLVARCRAMGLINLVTADGSVNCTNTPDCQEDVVSHLHYAETVAALRILSPGGCFVLKMFTFFEASSICLIYFLVCIFRCVTVFKPVTSKGGNSEVYVICEGLEMCPSEKFLETVLRNISNKQSCFISEAKIHPDFFQQLYKCAEMFAGMQIDVIERNIESFDTQDISKVSPEMEHFKQAVFLEFCRRFQLRSLPENYRITIPNAVPNFWRDSPRINEGTYTERVMKKSKSDQEIKEMHWKRYMRYEPIITCPNHGLLHVNGAPNLCPIYGKRFQRISWSLFVAGGLLHYFLELLRDTPASDEISTNCWMKRRGNVTLIEMQSFYRVSDHAKYIRDTVSALKTALNCDGVEKIVLLNFCPLAQVSAGVLFLFAREKHSRVQMKCRRAEISIDVYDKQLRDEYCGILERVENLLMKESVDSILLSLVDIRDIYANYAFMKLIRCFNNHFVMKMFRDLLSLM
ncbi:cap-specific mRNA (nucleoside-2'-O-)-methyltransferase 2 [Phlebotomus argentipes]|uniref:cap-specific mRNA (nucleoside-2'-O-)-methyltransferase 2 n=1 Tax=Phlebotomus argentipes TaxID=94469 RepID=UPI0028933187|nr:cap-specific mRNA (nucleoside-2'-O-)-methyltransferase 2 [Phlebotomus argentipes]